MVKPEARKTSSTSAFPVSLVGGLPTQHLTNSFLGLLLPGCSKEPQKPLLPFALPARFEAARILASAYFISSGQVLTRIWSLLDPPIRFCFELNQKFAVQPNCPPASAHFPVCWDRLFSCAWGTLSLSIHHLSWAVLLLQALLLYHTYQISLLNKLEPGDSFCYLSSSLLLGSCTLPCHHLKM